MHVCTYCDTTDNIVLISGKIYCRDCLKFVDSDVLAKYIADIIPTIEQQRIFFIWAFEDSCPKLSFLPRAYGILPRGDWNEKKKRFDVPQEEWVKSLAELYVQQQKRD